MNAAPPTVGPLQTAPVELARQHFEAKLRFEVDAHDLNVQLQLPSPRVVVVDARSHQAYQAGHIPRAISIPHREIRAGIEERVPRDSVVVVYCDGSFCNASTNAAAKFSALGYAVKELADGLRGWVEEGYAVERTA